MTPAVAQSGRPAAAVRPSRPGASWGALLFPWLFLALVGSLVGLDWARQGGSARLAVDPVCHMEVREGAGETVMHGGRRFSFCSTTCRSEFLKAPEHFASSGPTGGHTMRGIPTRMYQAGAAAVIFLSFGLIGAFGGRPSRGMSARFDLTELPGVRSTLRSGTAVLASRALMALLFLAVVASGLFGAQSPAMNIAPLLTWTVWWAGLIFLILFAGKAWCTVCPWDALASWAARFDRLRLPWPRWARNIWPAVVLFLALTWLELGAGITLIPRATAWVAIGMLALAVASAFLFDRKSFCRYGCLVGRVSGLYALFSGIEVRAKDDAVCASCSTQDCYRGNDRGDGCPTFEFPRAMKLNTYCTMCTECFKTCPHDNMALLLRPWGADLEGGGRPRADEAALALVLLSMTGFHGLTMTPSWPAWVSGLQSSWGLSYWPAFSLLMGAVLGLPILGYAALVKAAQPFAPGRPYSSLFVSYAYALLPIALFYHLAHNAEHFLMEGPKLLTLASDPLGRGWDLFGTASWRPVPLITLEGLWWVQLLFVLTGHLYGLWVADRAARRLSCDGKAAFVGQVPMVAAMAAFSVFSLWLLRQPMEMRVSGM